MNFNNQIKNCMLAFVVVGVLILIGVVCFKLWPEKITIIDLEKHPFLENQNQPLLLIFQIRLLIVQVEQEPINSF